MINAGTVQVKLFADIKQFTTGMHGATAAVSSMSKSVVNMSKTVIFALGAITAASAKMATDFDKRLREISTLVIGVTENNIKEFSREIRDLANTTGKALDDIGKAKYDIISAGFVDLAASAVMLNSATRLAVGGVTSVTKAADLLTSALNSWQLSGYEAEKAADILFTTVRLGKTTMDELSGSVGRVFPTARTIGATLADVGAAMATITASGISTYEAATYLNQAFTKLGAPSISAAKAMRLYGIEVKRFDNGMLDLMETIKQFQGYDLETMRKFFPEIRAIKAILSMSNNITFLQRAIDNTAKSAGASQEAFEKMEKSFSVQMQKSIMQIKDILIDIGDSVMPVVIEHFGNFVTVLDKNKSSLMGVAKAMVYLVGLLGQVLLNMPTIIAAFVAYKIAVNAAAIKTALLTSTMLINPVTAWAVGIAAVVAVLADFISNTVRARNEFIKFADEDKKYRQKDIPSGMKVNPQAYFDKSANAFIDIPKPKIGLSETTFGDWAGVKISDNKELAKSWIMLGNAVNDTYIKTKRLDFQHLDIDKFEWGALNVVFKDNNGIETLVDFQSEKYQKLLWDDINNFLDNVDIDAIGFRNKIGTGVIGDVLGLDNLRISLDNAKDAFDDLGISDITKEMLELQGINFNNFETALKRIDIAGISLGQISEYDLSTFGIDVVELEAILEILKQFGINLDNFNNNTDKTKEKISKTTEAVRVMGDTFGDIARDISQSMSSAFADMLLSGRTAMQELEDYNNYLSNSFRTKEEIMQQSWADMWDNILRNTIQAVTSIVLEIALIWAAIKIGDLLTKGAVSNLINGTTAIGEGASKFAEFIYALVGGSDFASVLSMNDGIVTPQGQVIKTAPDDYIMAMKNPQKLGENFGGGGNYNITINALDGADVERVLLRNQGAVARGVGTAINSRKLTITQSGARY